MQEPNMTALPSSRPYPTLDDLSPAAFNRFGAGTLPGHMGIEVLSVEPRRVVARMVVRPEIMSPNGFLHGATPVVIADTLCGYGCIAHLPAGAENFTTVELKTNFLNTAREGRLYGEARGVHLGRTTQVWDAVVTHGEERRKLALFRCTQLVLYPR
jgi:uncharacterized protein (TIGR00369 family)